MEQSRIALPIGTTLDRYIKSRQKEFSYATGELSQLLRDLALAVKVVNREINKAGLVDIIGAMGSTNIQDEDQQKLDVLANIRFKRAFERGGEVCALLSEEDDEPTILNKEAKYIVAIDPLDGSSNIDVNVSVGTIFSVFRRKSPLGSDITEEDFLQKGRDQVAAGYVLYGSSTMLVYSTGRGVNGFTYDPTLGEFVLSHPRITVPEEGAIFSVNEGNLNEFSDGLQAYVADCKAKKHSARYIGSLVADFHRNMLKGGVYLYPGTTSKPQGKLRLIYECISLALLIEQAGGKASDGEIAILDIQPTEMHQRSPLIIGSKNMVEKALSF